MNDAERAFRGLIDLLSGSLKQPADWTPILQIASETLTIGTLASAVLGSPAEAGLTDPEKRLLADVLNRARARNRRLREQVLEVIPALNTAGIEPILMRGIASLIEKSADAGRLLSDIDILVPRRQRDDAVRALLELGYDVFQGFHGPPHAVALGRSSDVGMVDLHTNLQPYSLGVTYERAAPLCRRTQGTAGAMLMPLPSCTLLLHILHDQLHDGDYWRGLIDARHLIEMRHIVAAGVDWPAIASFFPAGSPRNAMYVHLRTAKLLLGVDVPKDYMGGAWAALQVKRRMVQLRFPQVRPLFTLFSLALDPPRRGSGVARKRSMGRSLRDKVASAFRPVNAGKAFLPPRSVPDQAHPGPSA